MGAKCSCRCFGSAKGTETRKVVSESESLWPRFKRRIKQKRKMQSSKPAAFSNYSVQISPAYLISGGSKPLVRFVSNSGGREFIPVILSPVRKEMSNEQQPTKMKRKLGLEAAEVKVKSRNAEISVKPREPEVCTQELPPKPISDEEDPVAVKISCRRSWVRILKAFQFPKPADRNGPKVSQNPTQQNEVADSISRPSEQPCKSRSTSSAVDSKSNEPFETFVFRRKVSCHGSKCQGIKSTPLSQLPRPGMNSTIPSFQPKMINTSAGKKGTITGNATSEGEEYSMALNLSILIIIMVCLAVFSNRIFAVVCTSIWWYLLPSLLKKKLCRWQ